MMYSALFSQIDVFTDLEEDTSNTGTGINMCKYIMLIQYPPFLQGHLRTILAGLELGS
jgi:hypothetical protein